MSADDSSHPGPVLSDEELMSQLAAGRHDALGPLHGRYAPLVYNLAAQSIDRATAEEVVQDVFVAVWRKAGTFDPARGSFRAWVLRIAHLRVLNEFRSRGRRPKAEPDADGLRLPGVPEPGPGPAEVVWRSHRRAIVREAVDALPPAQRQALSLAFLEDLSHQQIAEFLDLPLGTAKTRVRAGLQALRAQLSPLLAAGLLAAGLLAALSYETAIRSDLRLNRDALRLVTSSDVVPLRLVAAPGAPADAHGQYRGRTDSALAVLTVSHLAPAPAGRVYQAWGHFDGRWLLLATPRPDAQGRDLRIAQGPHLTRAPRALKVTLENVGTPTSPIGPTVIAWPGP